MEERELQEMLIALAEVRPDTVIGLSHNHNIMLMELQGQMEILIDEIESTLNDW